jgi:hypothetical protein
VLVLPACARWGALVSAAGAVEPVDVVAVEPPAPGQGGPATGGWPGEVGFGVTAVACAAATTFA